MELTGKRAIVTGAGRGIGRTIAKALAAEGASVALLARTAEQIESVAAEIAAAGGTAMAQATDLRQAAQVRNSIASVLDAWGRVDILVNNAGMVGPIGLTSCVDAEEWMATVEVNLGGCLRCTQQVLPGMMERRFGKIINLSGGGATGPRPRFSASGASKAAIVRFTETLAEEVAEYGIDVNAIAPGAVNTAMLDEVLAAGESAGADAWEEAKRQAEEGGVDPSQAAALALFLASDRSNGLTGRLISAVWDSWEDLDIDAVMASEAYTMRRLKPPKESARKQ